MILKTVQISQVLMKVIQIFPNLHMERITPLNGNKIYRLARFVFHKHNCRLIILQSFRQNMIYALK